MTKINTIEALGDLKDNILIEREKFRATIVICGGTGCQASQSTDVIDAIRTALHNHGLTDSIALKTTGWSSRMSIPTAPVTPFSSPT